MFADGARSVEEWIRHVRLRLAGLELTQAEVEMRAGLSEGHLGKVLRGERPNPSLETALSIDLALSRVETEKFCKSAQASFVP